jgi:hypothetical protein
MMWSGGSGTSESHLRASTVDLGSRGDPVSFTYSETIYAVFPWVKYDRTLGIRGMPGTAAAEQAIAYAEMYRCVATSGARVWIFPYFTK